MAPGAVLLLGATVLLQSASLREAVTVSAPVYPWIVFWAGLLNIEWVLVASLLYLRKTRLPLEAKKATGVGELVQA